MLKVYLTHNRYIKISDVVTNSIVEVLEESLKNKVSLILTDGKAGRKYIINSDQIIYFEIT